jgi:hypothetical protein
MNRTLSRRIATSLIEAQRVAGERSPADFLSSRTSAENSSCQHIRAVRKIDHYICLFQNIRDGGAESCCSMDLDTTSKKELDRHFEVRISGSLSRKREVVCNLISLSEN